MQINSILNTTSTSDISLTNQKEQSNNFGKILEKSIEIINDTNNLQKESEEVTLAFAAGETDNIHEVMIAAEKANIALQYTVEIRNKFMDAYNEIMRMQL